MKIGFLATSGLRVCDRRLIALGLKMPSIMQRAQAIASLPTLGLLYVAAVTPSGHELHYWEAKPEPASDGKIEWASGIIETAGASRGIRL